MAFGRGAVSDRVTQQWVWTTGRRVDAAAARWLDGPVGDPEGIGGDFFRVWAEREGLAVVEDGAPRGLIPDFRRLEGPSFDPSAVHPDVRRFYEETSAFELEAWSEWRGPFRAFGWLLARLFSRRLQQLNVPLRPLDTSLGTSSEVLHLLGPDGGVVMAAWVRHLRRSGDVLYAGAYSLADLPGHADPCVHVVFPLPNGNANVFLKPEVDGEGALTLLSRGRSFGDPGFYFTVRGPEGTVRARYVRTMQESIRVHAVDDGEVRADHVMWIFRTVFLRLHYRLRPVA